MTVNLTLSLIHLAQRNMFTYMPMCVCVCTYVCKCVCVCCCCYCCYLYVWHMHIQVYVEWGVSMHVEVRAAQYVPSVTPCLIFYNRVSH